MDMHTSPEAYTTASFSTGIGCDMEGRTIWVKYRCLELHRGR
jgi:hypothetical protein